jgi:hypothetical protein
MELMASDTSPGFFWSMRIESIHAQPYPRFFAWTQKFMVFWDPKEGADGSV